jgi:hypothetical protein
VPEAAADDHLGATHPNLLPIWWIAGWSRRKIPDGAHIHHSVRQRIDAGSYHIPLPSDIQYVSCPSHPTTRHPATTTRRRRHPEGQPGRPRRRQQATHRRRSPTTTASLG